LVTKLIETTTLAGSSSTRPCRKGALYQHPADQEEPENVIGDILRRTNFAVTADFLDNIKELGFTGLSKAVCRSTLAT
jgi:hypothetical protein